MVERELVAFCVGEGPQIDLWQQGTNSEEDSLLITDISFISAKKQISDIWDFI